MTFPENFITTIACPKCGALVKLIVKTNTKTGRQFLGCPNFPACDYTREIPEEWKMRQAGQQELPGLSV